MQEAAGGAKRLNRVDWMYSGPSSGQAGTTEEMEGYLLGKRRIDGLVKGTENKKLEKATSEESFMALQHANTVKDTASKIREDPMLAIKRQEQAAYEAMMNDPVRRRLLLKAAGKDVEAKEKDRKHRKHRHHSNRGEGKDRRPEDHNETDRSRKRRRIHDDRYSRDSRPHDRRRSLSSSPSSSRSPSPYRRRSPSPYYRSRKSSVVMRRSRSPDEYRNNHHRLNKSKSLSSLSFRHSLDSRHKSPPQQGVNDRAAKLAAMQQAASELDIDREKRIAAMAEREKRNREVDETARARSAKYGGAGDFVSGMNRKAGEMDLGERMRRGRGGYQRERDD